MSIALGGIVFLQYTMLKESYTQKEMIFDQSVSSALIDVSKKVEKQEAINFIRTKINEPVKLRLKNKTNVTRSARSKNRNKNTIKNKQQDLNKEIKNQSQITYSHSEVLDLPVPPIPPQVYNFEFPDFEFQFDIENERDNDKIKQQHSNRQKRIKHVQDSLRKIQKSFELRFKEQYKNAEISANSRMADSLLRLSVESMPSYYEYFSDSGKIILWNKRSPSSPPRIAVAPGKPISRSQVFVAPVAPKVNSTKVYDNVINSDEEEIPEPELDNVFISNKNNKIDILNEIATEMEVLRVPIEHRIDSNLIDSLLAVELAKRGIWQQYDVLIQLDNKDVFYKTSNIDINNNFAFYSINLFEDPEGRSKAKINVSFPNKDKIISNQMGPSIAISIMLLSTLIGIFVYTIRAILKQKKISDLKNDFINNMTHEFKTPVSTILLASEALKDNTILTDENRVQRLAGIIYDENLRLSEHVERVLNMAKMDKGEVKLAMNSIGLHEILKECLVHFELTLENKNQSVELNLNATNDNIYVDVFHLKNIIHNLIDNASKYSKENTTISISTYNTKNELVLSVKDQGIGMKKEQLKKIFEPFYRVPTGNLHDVKGFGIGLHYVYTILKLMSAKIQIQSELGKGSEFSVYFSKKLN